MATDPVQHQQLPSDLSSMVESGKALEFFNWLLQTQPSHVTQTLLDNDRVMWDFLRGIDDKELQHMGIRDATIREELVGKLDEMQASSHMFFRVMISGRIHSLDCSSGGIASWITLDSTVADLQRAIVDVLPLPRSYNGGGDCIIRTHTKMEGCYSHQTLRSCGITWGSTLIVAFRVDGGAGHGTLGNKAGGQKNSTSSRCRCGNNPSFRCGNMHQSQATVAIYGQEYRGSGKSLLTRKVDLTRQNWGVDAKNMLLLDDDKNVIARRYPAGLVRVWAKFQRSGRIEFKIESECFNCGATLDRENPVCLVGEKSGDIKEIRFDENNGVGGACCDKPDVEFRHCIVEWKSSSRPRWPF